MASDSLLIGRAEEAADRLFDARNGDAAPTYEPTSLPEAQAAIRRLSERFERLPGAISEALDAARASANLISSDRFQGIAEIIQNADDVDASQVRLLLGPTDLWIGHDGSPVQLRHVLGLATPWLSTKGSEADTTGRFGIGLMTLRSLSNTLEIHCHPYHVQLGEPTLSPIDPPTPPPGFEEAGWTTLRVPLERGDVSPEELEEWLDRWDDAALLFLRSISKVTLLDQEGAPIRQLAISRYDAAEVLLDEWNPSRRVLRQRVEAAAGRSWVVYGEDVSTPAGVLRAHKATETTTPIAIALPQYAIDHGQLHAGLPITRTRLPIFANAQFDPLTNRRDFADNEWNKAIVPLVADLWSRAALDLFSRDPKAAWQAMPLPNVAEGDGPYSFTDGLEEAIIVKARQWVASQLSFPVSGQGELRLSQLAVEAQSLEQILSETETAALAGLPATLPFRVRDQAGRWRLVLDDWRTGGANIPEQVSVERALDFVGDQTRPADSTIALTAAGLDAGLDERLMELPCVISRDGRHIVPPDEDSADALAAETTPLAEQLGIVTMLHPAHLGDGKPARTVLKWLRESGFLLRDTDDWAVVQRLAAAGRAGRQIETPLTDEQVQSLRAAFELIDPDEREELGAAVGSAIRLQAFEYELRGRRKKRKSTSTRPGEAYLPKAVDRDTDSFAIAADQSPDISWLSGHYARILRSPAGRQGVGAQRFLVLLGAETAPRLRLHPKLEWRYNDQRRGLQAWLPRSPLDRSLELKARDATYTLQDRDCPTLATVAQDISRLRRAKQRRRRRAAALLATLARAWDRAFNDFTTVDSARDYYGWDLKGQTPAYWLWEIGAIAWLDDESGTPRRPSDLRLRTHGNVAIYGQDSPDYLHPDLDQLNWRTVLAALGVSGDPSRSELVTRLKGIRDDADYEGRWTPEELKQETSVIYKALAQSLTPASGRSDRSPEQLRRDFRHRGGLIYSNLGWLPPQGVLAGPPIFGRFKAFAPAIADTGPLWAALRLGEPSFEDCVEVIRMVARNRRTPGPHEEAILLQTMRALESHAETGVTTQTRDKLRRLPLWTSKGWLRDRPVYATDDPVLATGLRDQLPLWEPGGELQQFRSLLNSLRVEEIRATSTEVIEPSLATEYEESSELFGSAIRHLQEDLARNDPRLAQSIRVPWQLLEGFRVYVHPSLSLGVPIGHDDAGVSYQCNVMAKVDKDRGVVFVQNPAELTRVDSGGRAIATLFEGDPRQLALVWRAACDRAESGRQARLIELAEQRSKREQDQTESDIARRIAEFREHTDAKHRALDGTRQRSAATSSSLASIVNAQEDNKVPATSDSLRVLVDPQDLRLVDPLGRIEKQEATRRPKPASKGRLTDPMLGDSGPRSGIPLRLYSDLDKETVGLELLRKLFSSDQAEIADLRAQRGVGADAIDELQRFYELKVSAGAEPDQITMTGAEVKRARTTPDFFLVVISGIEGVDAQPRVRVIVDPLSQLQPTESGSITLSGVRSATSLTYDFAPNDDTAQASEEDETGVSAE